MPRLEPGDALARLRSARIARLATADASGRPHLVPVTFALSPDDRLLVSAVDQKPKTTTNLARLRNIAAQPRVAVLVDRYDEDWSQLWWVRADGVAAIRTGADRSAPITWLAAKYPQYRDNSPRGPVIAIALDTVTGWAYTE
ncbi:TIGR03668 family PPOX class F420-dependent oxidoreductase [Nocardia spumae]|uniref:TIGR03668 family PPOX class F420-dependent oxidoreductase n=1 Tax=Nocardia spumae TaxID=2887190 RepID=UPI001D132942|nr:TIGR03668 family PPOX class F420-dependent oxidoreductase [Nocardia spumae]